MRLWVIIALTELIAFFRTNLGMALHHAVRQCRLGPCPQAPQTLGKSPFARGMIRLPHPLLDLSKCVAQCFGGSITDCEKRMEKTQDHRDVGDRAFQAPCVACQPSVLTVSGASSASTACASLAKTPYAFSKALWEADRATDAPKIQSCAAVVAMYTRSPFNQRCFSSATRALGHCSGFWTVVPTRLKRPRPCSRRYQYIASWPNT